MNSIMDMTEAELDETLSVRRRGRLAALNFDTPPATGGDLTSTTRAAAGVGGGRAGQAGAVTAAPLLAGHASYRAAPALIARQVDTVAAVDYPSSRRAAPTIKLSSYEGSTPLETHLAKLDVCADYYGWSARDRLCHLKASLDGHAGQVLWELGPNGS